MPGKKVVVVAAINGGMQQDREGAKIPSSPAEIAEEAHRCYKAGAAVVHVHARDENKRNSGDPKLYAEIIQRIRDKCEILIQTTNGIGVRRDPKTGQLVWPSDEERLQLLKLQPRQDLFGIATGSMDFYHPEGGYTQETPYVNSLDLLRQTILAVYGIGSTVEYEVVEASALHRLMRLAEQGVFDKNASNIWLLHGGGFGATPPLARNALWPVRPLQTSSYVGLGVRPPAYPTAVAWMPFPSSQNMRSAPQKHSMPEHGLLHAVGIRRRERPVKNEMLARRRDGRCAAGQRLGSGRHGKRLLEAEHGGLSDDHREYSECAGKAHPLRESASVNAGPQIASYSGVRRTAIRGHEAPRAEPGIDNHQAVKLRSRRASPYGLGLWFPGSPPSRQSRLAGAPE